MNSPEGHYAWLIIAGELGIEPTLSLNQLAGFRSAHRLDAFNQTILSTHMPTHACVALSIPADQFILSSPLSCSCDSEPTD